RVRSLSVLYKGDGAVGGTLTARGISFLVKEGRTNIDAPDLLTRVFGFYEKLPEVRQVEYVRKIYPDRVEVKLDLREPFVRIRDVYFDREGCRLSRKFNQAVSAEPIPAVQGLRYPRGLEAGDVWENIYFKEVLKALEAVESKLAVQNVIIPRSGRPTHAQGIILQTQEGASVYWGSVFQQGTDVGISVDKKIRNLNNALRIIARNMDRVDYADISRDKPVIAYK
ncbi:hypothetical protein ACFL4W_04235, partial [Planctomycetota bacterium]